MQPYQYNVTQMEPLQFPKVGEIVLIKRNDHNGDRIPMEYRMYISDKTYMYKAKIVHVFEDKAYNRVQPLPLSADMHSEGSFTRKGYKTKTYTLHV